MLDDGVIYEGRKASGRTRHRSVIPKSESLELRRVGRFEGFSKPTEGMPRDSREPEVAHPGCMDHRTRCHPAMATSEAGDRANALRSAGKETFLSVLKETAELVALEAASQAISEETDRIEGLRHAEMMRGSTNRSSTNRSITTNMSNSNSGRTLDPPPNRPPSLPRGNSSASTSASGSRFQQQQQQLSPMRHAIGNSNSNGNGYTYTPNNSERRRRKSRNALMAKTEGMAVVATAAVVDDVGRQERGGGAGSMSFRSTVNTMGDEERETLLSLLTGAYSQVNELTDELQIALKKLHEAEKTIQESEAADIRSMSMSDKTSEAPRDEESGDDGGEIARSNSKSKIPGKLLKGFFPIDEGARSTPATVRQLQVEVQRLRQRVMQARAKEEKYRAELAHNQRRMAVMESQMASSDAGGSTPSISPTTPTPSAGSLLPKKRANGSSAGSHDAKPLVDRVAELEEKLVNCSMENATAKQDHLASKLRASQLEKNADRIRHELAKSRAMNNLLQDEIDRLQGVLSPEGEADGKGWRRWLGGVQEPLSPEPIPIRVHAVDGDSPVVVVRDLDNNQLVYAPGRSEFF